MDEQRGFEAASAPGVPPPPPGVPDPAGGGAAVPPTPPPAPPHPPAPEPAPPGAWGAPSPAPAPGWGSPHDPTPATGAWGAPSPAAQVGWDRPQGGSNGCLKACLIVGLILVGLAIVAAIALVALGGRLAQQIADNPDAVFGGACPFVSTQEVSAAIGKDAQVFELSGFADGTMGAVMDKRLLADAQDCWLIGQDGTTGRIAVQDGGGATAFATAKEAASGFTLRTVDEVGDEALCTTLDAAGFGGVLVRFGDRVAYVSMLDQTLDAEAACTLAISVAGTLAP